MFKLCEKLLLEHRWQFRQGNLTQEKNTLKSWLNFWCFGHRYRKESAARESNSSKKKFGTVYTAGQIHNHFIWEEHSSHWKTTTNRKDTLTWLLELLVRWGGTKADPESGPGCSQPLSPPALLSQWRAPAEEGPQPFSIFHFCISPWHPNTNVNVKSILNSSRAAPALKENAIPAHTSSTDIPHRSAIYLSPQHKSSEYKAKPKVVTLCDWLAPEGRVGLYTSSWLAQAQYSTTGTGGTTASTIHLQTSWHKQCLLMAAVNYIRAFKVLF